MAVSFRSEVCSGAEVIPVSLYYTYHTCNNVLEFNKNTVFVVKSSLNHKLCPLHNLIHEEVYLSSLTSNS